MTPDKLTYWKRLETVNKVWESGWKCKRDWIFESPSGSLHDLSAAAISQLDRIERNGYFLVA